MIEKVKKALRSRCVLIEFQSIRGLEVEEVMREAYVEECPGSNCYRGVIFVCGSAKKLGQQVHIAKVCRDVVEPI